MGGMNELNLKNYENSLKYMSKAIQIDPFYNKVMYLVCIICNSNILNYN